MTSTAKASQRIGNTIANRIGGGNDNNNTNNQIRTSDASTSGDIVMIPAMLAITESTDIIDLNNWFNVVETMDMKISSATNVYIWINILSFCLLGLAIFQYYGDIRSFVLYAFERPEQPPIDNGNGNDGISATHEPNEHHKHSSWNNYQCLAYIMVKSPNYKEMSVIFVCLIISVLNFGYSKSFSNIIAYYSHYFSKASTFPWSLFLMYIIHFLVILPILITHSIGFHLIYILPIIICIWLIIFKILPMCCLRVPRLKICCCFRSCCSHYLLKQKDQYHIANELQKIYVQVTTIIRIIISLLCFSVN